MGYDGNGNFLRIHSWVADAAAGIKIRSDRHDAEDDNFADGLSNALTRDGQSQPTADIPMNEYKIIALGAPTDPADAATKAYVDGKKTYTNDIEVTDQVIFKDGPTTRGSITGVIGSANPAKLFFETNDAAGVAINSMFLDVNGLTVSLGDLTIPSNITAGGKITAAGDVQGVRGIFSSNVDINKTVFVRDTAAGNVMRGYIDWATGAGNPGSMTIEVDSPTAVMVNRAAMNSGGWYVASGSFVAENGGAILRGDVGVLITSTGATPKIRGSLICDTGSASGTTAVRSYNNAGTQDGLIYVSSIEFGSDRPSLNIYNLNDQAIWFRKGTGEIRGGVYNYQSGRTEMRSYDTSGVLQNLITVDPSRQGWSYSTLWTWNANGLNSDVDIRHRVTSGGRGVRWYYAQGGDVFLQESDDNFVSHFIGLYSYSRSTGNSTFPNKVLSPAGFEILGAAGSNNGVYMGTGDAASFATYNVMLRSWNGIGFPSSLDGVNRIFMNTRNGDIYSQARIQGNDLVSVSVVYCGGGASWLATDGDIKFSGGMATTYGASLGNALSARGGGVYTGGGQDDTVFPVGHQVLGQTGDGIVLIRNSAQLLYLSSNYSYSYTGTTGCGGSWRMRGGYDSPGSGAWAYSWQRMA